MEQQITLEKVQKLQVIKKMCADSYLFFIETYLEILQFDDLQRAANIPLKLFDYQKEYLQEIDAAYKFRYDVGVRKSRKAGYSWVTMAYFYWRWLFTPDFHGLVGSHKMDTLDKKGNPDTLMGKLDVFLQTTPKWLLPEGFVYHKHRIEGNLRNPVNRSIIKGETSITEFARSGRHTMIMMDELAFWENIELSLKASISSCKCRIMGSSYNGFNEFHELVNSGNIKVFDMNWEKNPVYNIGMYYDEEAGRWTSPEIEKEKQRYLSTGLGLKGFLEEIYMEPVKEGSSVFNMAKLPLCENSVVHPQVGDRYSVGVDTAAAGGYNVDKQVIVVESAKTGETVYYWEGNEATEVFAWRIIEVANKFNKALVVIESNRGQAVIEILVKFYKNLYRKVAEDSVSRKMTLKVGFYTSGASKEPAILALQSEIELGRKKCCHPKIIEQMRHYADLGNGKYGAPSKNIHDDAVMAYMLSTVGIRSEQLGTVLTTQEVYKREFKKKNRVVTYMSDTCNY